MRTTTESGASRDIDFGYSAGIHLALSQPDQPTFPWRISTAPLSIWGEQHQQLLPGVTEALQHPRTIVYRDGKHKVRGRIATFGPDDAAEVRVMNPSWAVPIDSPLNAAEMAARCAAQPDVRFVFVELPGVNRQSNALPATMMRHATKTGSFMPVGEMLYDGLAKAELGDLHLFDGISLGGRIAIAMAASAAAPREVIAIDPPGSRAMTEILGLPIGPGSIGAQFMIHTNENGKQ
jgi:hypothetical protein